MLAIRRKGQLGTDEALTERDILPIQKEPPLAVAGGTVYVTTLGGNVVWWRDGRMGVIPIGTDIDMGITASGDGVLVGSSGQIVRIVDGGEPELVVETEHSVTAIAVSGETLIWLERSNDSDVVHRRPLAGGAVEKIHAAKPNEVGPVLAAAPGGAVFAMAGIARMPPWRFLLCDAAAACISIPFVLSVGFFGSRHVARMRAGVAHFHHYVLLVVALGVLGYVTYRHVRQLRGLRAA